MECCPFLSPCNGSNLFPGGTIKSCKVLELWSIISFRSAVCCMSGGNFLENRSLYTASVSASLNDKIMYNITVY